MAVVANQAVAFYKSMLTTCPHLGDVLRPGLILDHAPLVRSSDRRRVHEVRIMGRSRRIHMAV
jgi:hypothetical protein